MKKNISVLKDKILIIDYCLLILSFITSIFDWSNISIVLLIVASILFIKIIKDIIGNYMSFTVLFSCFHVLYGLAGVISKCWFNQMSSTYGNVFVYSPYLMMYSLCTIALLTGIIFSNKKGEIKVNKTEKDNKEKKRFFLFIAYSGFLLTSLFEIINFARVGGIETLLKGKAIYQAAVDELIFTLPTLYIFEVSFAAFCIFLLIYLSEKNKVPIKEIFICLGFALPYIAMIILLGRRGPILVSVLMVLIALFQIKPLKNISVKLIAGLIAVYLILGVGYAIRNDIGLIFKDFEQFRKNNSVEKIIKNLNPALTEFGCTYGNFNKFYIAGDYELLYGKSYLQGLVHVIPTYLYPGQKPRMITYEFRDKYFPAKAEISSIASTGFSSILEAYWNFWYFGAFVYFLYGYMLIILEKRLKNKSYFWMLEYISIIATVYSFHRSEFGHSISEIIMITMEIVVIYAFYKIVYNRENMVSNFIKKYIK